MVCSRREAMRSAFLSGAGMLLCRPARAAALLGRAARGGDREPEGALFFDGFDAPSLGSKPPYTVMCDVKDDDRWLHTPSIIEGRDGVLLAAWSSNGPHGDNDPTNYIEVVRSLDGGVTWSDPSVAVPPSAINPVFLRARNDDVILFYIANRSLRQDDGAIAWRRSRDNGLSWSEATTVDNGPSVAIIVNNGLTLPDGSWLISYHYDRAQQGDHFNVANADYVACVAISSDEGHTWKRYDAASIPNESHNPNSKSWAVEPAVILTATGALRMVIRSRSGYLYECVSRDLGKTWSPAQRMAFSNDDSKPSLLELRGGKELLLWNDTRILDGQYRFPLLATLSDDDGSTWFRSVDLEDANVTLDYPTAVQVGDAIKLVYGYDRRQMRFVNLHESDFKPWVPVNDSGAWKVKDGVLGYAGDRGGTISEKTPDWLHWSKAICFLPARPSSSSLAVDFRIDDKWAKDGEIGIFAAYQDEANWTAWTWRPGDKVAGMRQEAHCGSMTHPYHATNISNFYDDAIEPAETGVWYRLEVALRPGWASYRLIERESRRLILAAEEEIAWEGRFLALGSREIALSFDNVEVR